MRDILRIVKRGLAVGTVTLLMAGLQVVHSYAASSPQPSLVGTISGTQPSCTYELVASVSDWDPNAYPPVGAEVVRWSGPIPGSGTRTLVYATPSGDPVPLTSSTIWTYSLSAPEHAAYQLVLFTVQPSISPIGTATLDVPDGYTGSCDPAPTPVPTPTPVQSSAAPAPVSSGTATHSSTTRSTLSTGNTGGAATAQSSGLPASSAKAGSSAVARATSAPKVAASEIAVRTQAFSGVPTRSGVDWPAIAVGFGIALFALGLLSGLMFVRRIR